MRKGRFPAETVYGPADDAALTSITFGGFFDRGRGHYRDVVVYAVADGPGTLGPVTARTMTAIAQMPVSRLPHSST
jgi:hypothetical protein